MWPIESIIENRFVGCDHNRGKSALYESIYLNYKKKCVNGVIPQDKPNSGI